MAKMVAHETSVSFTHTFTQPRRWVRGLAAELIDFAMQDVEATTGARVVPVCWYVAQWFDAHPDRRELLTR